MEKHNWWGEAVKVQPDGATELLYAPKDRHPGVGQSTNKKRPKRKPRPQKSARRRN